MPKKLGSGPASAERPLVVMGRDYGQLEGVRRSSDPQEDVKMGRATRQKVEGIWLYAKRQDDIDNCIAGVRRAALQVCSEWFLAPMRPLAGTVARDFSIKANMEVVRPILRSLARSRDLHALPSLTLEFDPQFALLAPSDDGYLESLISSAVTTLREAGCVRVEDLPVPRPALAGKAWRGIILSHLEWAGEGCLQSGALYRADCA